MKILKGILLTMAISIIGFWVWICLITGLLLG